MKKLNNFSAVCITGSLMAISVFAGCGGKQDSKMDHFEDAQSVAAVETADQMEAAKEGREAARAIVNKNWADSMQLQQAIIDARAKSSKYEINKDQAGKAAFDTAFFNAIRTVRPDLADQLQP